MVLSSLVVSKYDTHYPFTEAERHRIGAHIAIKWLCTRVHAIAGQMGFETAVEFLDKQKHVGCSEVSEIICAIRIGYLLWTPFLRKEIANPIRVQSQRCSLAFLTVREILS